MAVINFFVFGPPATYAGAIGDIGIRPSNGEQWRWDGALWQPMLPDESRGDIMPSPATGGLAGLNNTHLAKTGARSFEVGWVNPSEGIVFQHDQATALDAWTISHPLQSRWLDITVISPGNTNPAATEHDIIVPAVNYATMFSLTLRFLEPIAGTAILRR